MQQVCDRTENLQGNLFGSDRLVDLMEKHHRLIPNELVETIEQTVKKFTGKDYFTDDFTCIVVRIDNNHKGGKHNG